MKYSVAVKFRFWELAPPKTMTVRWLGRNFYLPCFSPTASAQCAKRHTFSIPLYPHAVREMGLALPPNLNWIRPDDLSVSRKGIEFVLGRGVLRMLPRDISWSELWLFGEEVFFGSEAAAKFALLRDRHLSSRKRKRGGRGPSKIADARDLLLDAVVAGGMKTAEAIESVREVLPDDLYGKLCDVDAVRQYIHRERNAAKLS